MRSRRRGGRNCSPATPSRGRSCRCSSRCWSSPGAASCGSPSRGRSRAWKSSVTSPLAKLLEAALFASARPVAADELAALDPDASERDVEEALAELRTHYDDDG